MFPSYILFITGFYNLLLASHLAVGFLPSTCPPAAPFFPSSSPRIAIAGPRRRHHYHQWQYQQLPCKRLQQAQAATSDNKAVLLPDPSPNAIGNFFENKTAETMAFIQCYMLAMGSVNGEQYGVGYPIDMPVMLTYFEDNQLKPVLEDYPDYDHLINHVAVQLDYNDLQLYKTPVSCVVCRVCKYVNLFIFCLT